MMVRSVGIAAGAGLQGFFQGLVAGQRQRQQQQLIDLQTQRLRDRSQGLDVLSTVKEIGNLPPAVAAATVKSLNDQRAASGLPGLPAPITEILVKDSDQRQQFVQGLISLSVADPNFGAQQIQQLFQSATTADHVTLINQAIKAGQGIAEQELNRQVLASPGAGVGEGEAGVEGPAAGTPSLTVQGIDTRIRRALDAGQIDLLPELIQARNSLRPREGAERIPTATFAFPDGSAAEEIRLDDTQEVQRVIDEGKISTEVRSTPGELTSRARSTVRRERARATSNVSANRDLLRKIETAGGGAATLRRSLGLATSGLAELIAGEAAGREVSEFITGLPPGELAELSGRLQALVAQSVEQFTGEQTGRISDRELAITGRATRINAATASFSQLVGALTLIQQKEILRRDRLRMEEGLAPSFPLDTDQDINAAFRQIKRDLPLMSDEEISQFVADLIEARTDLIQQGFGGGDAGE